MSYFQTIQQKSINPDSIARVGAAWGNVMAKAGSVIGDVIKDQKENKQLQQTADAIIKMNPNIGNAFDGDSKKLAQALKKGGLGPYIQLEQLKMQESANKAQLAQIEQNALYRKQEAERLAAKDAREAETHEQQRTKFFNELAREWVNANLSGDTTENRAKIEGSVLFDIAEYSPVAADVISNAYANQTDSAFQKYLDNMRGVKSETKKVERKADGTVVTTSQDSAGNRSETVDGTKKGYGTPVSLTETYKNEPTVLGDLKKHQLLNATPGTDRWNAAQAVATEAKKREQSAVKFVSDSINASPLGTKKDMERLQSARFVLGTLKAAKAENNIPLATAATTGFIRMFETGVLTEGDAKRYGDQGAWNNLRVRANKMVGNVDKDLMDELIQATEEVYAKLTPGAREQLERTISSASQQFQIGGGRLNEILPFADIPKLMTTPTSTPNNSGASEDEIDNLTDN